MFSTYLLMAFFMNRKLQTSKTIGKTELSLVINGRFILGERVWKYKNSSNMTLPDQSTGVVPSKYYFPNATTFQLRLVFRTLGVNSQKTCSRIIEALAYGLNLAQFWSLTCSWSWSRLQWCACLLIRQIRVPRPNEFTHMYVWSSSL